MITLVDLVKHSTYLAKHLFNNPANDRITGLQTLTSSFSKLETKSKQKELALLYLDIENFRAIEVLYGRKICDRILVNIADILKQIPISFCGNREKIVVTSIGGDDFLIFIDKPPNTSAFQREYAQLKETLEKQINSATRGLGLAKPLTLHIGYAPLKSSPEFNIESLVYKAIKSASFAAKRCDSSREHARWQIMNEIIDNRQITCLYQPIVSLKNANLLGYEALARGPVGSIFESPACLFSAAQDFKCMLELEQLCVHKAITSIAHSLKDQYLFLNVSPFLLEHLLEQGSILQNLLKDNGINSTNVVLELTERTKIENYTYFRDTLRYCRKQGFLFAIDDAGAGYSSLQAIAELQPDFVKIDASLIREINNNPTKKAMLETLVEFSYKTSSNIICEGIESREELQVISSLGCGYGQGFYLARPGTISQEINRDAIENIKIFARDYQEKSFTLPQRLSDIMVPNQSIKPDVTVSDVIEIFDDNISLCGLVVCEQGVPVGLIMRDRLYSILGRRYGYDLFYKRPIKDIMDKNPMIAPWYTPLEEAAHLFAQELSHGTVNYLIVVKDGQYQGVVSISSLLGTMAKNQVEQAKDSNPLTGLPGNKAITQRLINDLNKKEAIAVLYFDLDNFKSFNDYYGFEHGDRAIILLAQIIKNVVNQNGNDYDLTGHVGGDDFIVITTPDKAHLIANKVIDQFDSRILELYDSTSLKEGCIYSTNRRGEVCKFPIMSVSIAGVSNSEQQFENHLHLGEVAADLKKAAKAIKGSCFVFDRRKNLEIPLKTSLQGSSFSSSM